MHEYCVPQCVYSSCSSLKKLCLNCCKLNINGNVEWNQLKSLTIQNSGVSQHVIDKILSGSPLLEFFILSLVQTDDNLNLSFRSTSLKELSICQIVGFLDYNKSRCTELRIWTPNLGTLKILGLAYRKCLLMNVNATLGFCGVFGKDYLRESLKQILASIQHVEGVALSDWCIKMIGIMKSWSLLPLSNVKFLKLNGNFEKLEQIVHLLGIFPKIKRLVLENNDDIRPVFHAESNCSFLMELRRVEVTWSEHDFSIFPLIEILLKYASKLEKIVFQVKGIVPPATPSKSLFLASQKLLRMPRSSPTAELIFCEY